MKANFLGAGAVIVLAVASAAVAQTSCGIEHTGPGVFICYPNPSDNPGAAVPELFHVSAQANAPEGSATRHYAVFLDNQLLYDNRLATPLQRLSIEANVRSPFTSGAHTLRIAVSGIGTAEVKNLNFHPWANAGFCEPLTIVQSLGACFSSLKAPLDWSVDKFAAAASKSPVTEYRADWHGYRRNLKSLEADIADAVALDSQGNLYVALHLFAGMELRKYTPNRSIVYDAVVQTCGEGFLAISGLAVDHAGHAWIAGNTSGCLSGTAGAWRPHVAEASGRHGFVVLLDTSKPTSTAPLYLTYLADAENEISAIRADADGNAYVTGTTSSAEFPHKTILRVRNEAPGKSGRISFVSVLNKSGSALQWSALLPDMDATALAVDEANDVYVAGRAGGGADAMLARISENGSKLSRVTRLGPGDVRALSIAPNGTWAAIEQEPQMFLLAMEACTGRLPREEDSIGEETSMQLALDAFTAARQPGAAPCQNTQ